MSNIFRIFVIPKRKGIGIYTQKINKIKKQLFNIILKIIKNE